MDRADEETVKARKISLTEPEFRVISILSKCIDDLAREGGAYQLPIADKVRLLLADYVQAATR